MKQNKQEHLERTNQLISLGESIFKQTSPIFDGEEFDDRINLGENVTKTIRDKRQKISEIDNKKEELILKIIGQLHNGVLIPEKLSFRKGKVYEYRRQNSASLNTIKETIMTNLHEVSEKLSKNNLDVLEFVLQKQYTNPNSHLQRNRGWNNNDGEERQKVIRFPELKIIEKSRNRNVAETEFTIITLNGLTIRDDGDIEFFYEFKDVEDKGKLKMETPSIENETFAGLYIKFEKEIEENAEVFIQELNTEIINAEKDIAEITDKGQNQLALCELMVGDVKPYAR